jgi:hypothetical protein
MYKILSEDNSPVYDLNHGYIIIYHKTPESQKPFFGMNLEGFKAGLAY